MQRLVQALMPLDLSDPQALNPTMQCSNGEFVRRRPHPQFMATNPRVSSSDATVQASVRASEAYRSEELRKFAEKYKGKSDCIPQELLEDVERFAEEVQIKIDCLSRLKYQQPQNETQLAAELGNLRDLLKDCNDTLNLLYETTKNAEKRAHYASAIAADQGNVTLLVNNSYEHAVEIFRKPKLAENVDFRAILPACDDYLKIGLCAVVGDAFIRSVVAELMRRIDAGNINEVTGALSGILQAANSKKIAATKLSELIRDELIHRLKNELVDHEITTVFASYTQFLRQCNVDNNRLNAAIDTQFETKMLAFVKIYTAMQRAQYGGSTSCLIGKEDLPPRELLDFIEKHRKEKDGNRTNQAWSLLTGMNFPYGRSCNSNNILLFNAIYAFAVSNSRDMVSLLFWTTRPETLTASSIAEKKKQPGPVKTIDDILSFNGSLKAFYQQFHPHYRRLTNE